MITREQAERVCAKHGLKMASPDSPIYKEPPSVRFVAQPETVEDAWAGRWQEIMELSRKELDEGMQRG